MSIKDELLNRYKETKSFGKSQYNKGYSNIRYFHSDNFIEALYKKYLPIVFVALFLPLLFCGIWHLNAWAYMGMVAGVVVVAYIIKLCYVLANPRANILSSIYHAEYLYLKSYTKINAITKKYEEDACFGMIAFEISKLKDKLIDNIENLQIYEILNVGKKEKKKYLQVQYANVLIFLDKQIEIVTVLKFEAQAKVMAYMQMDTTPDVVAKYEPIIIDGEFDSYLDYLNKKDVEIAKILKNK